MSAATRNDAVWPGLAVVVLFASVFIIAPATCGIVQESRRAKEARAVEEATTTLCDLAPAARPIRATLDDRCDTLRCPPGTHAEWRPRMLGQMPDPRCVEGP